jgi:hypothetical protein
MVTIFDFETTGISPFASDPIEGYFAIEKDEKIIDEYYLKVRPSKWCKEAEKVHKIKFGLAMTYPHKQKAWRDFLKWYEPYKESDLCCYSKPIGNIHFDVGILTNQLNLVFGDNFTFYNYFKGEILYPYSEVKRKLKLKSNSMPNVYSHLFNKNYDAHNCKADVFALIRIKNAIKNKSDLLI